MTCANIRTPFNMSNGKVCQYLIELVVCNLHARVSYCSYSAIEGMRIYMESEDYRMWPRVAVMTCTVILTVPLIIYFLGELGSVMDSRIRQYSIFERYSTFFLYYSLLVFLVCALIVFFYIVSLETRAI